MTAIKKAKKARTRPVSPTDMSPVDAADEAPTAAEAAPIAVEGAAAVEDAVVVEGAAVEAASAELQDEGVASVPTQKREDANILSVKLSAALVSKLKHSAQDEGISLDMLVSELLAEGVALRAWEIIERKGAMRGIAPSHPQQGGNFRNGNGSGNSGNNTHNHGGNGNSGNRRGGPNQKPHNGHGNQQGGGQRRPAGGGNAWMEDRAAFLEYVRSQEKRR